MTTPSRYRRRQPRESWTNEDRLAYGMVRIGYNADTSCYKFRDTNDGSVWKGSPGWEYGGLMTQLCPASRPLRPAPSSSAATTRDNRPAGPKETDQHYPCISRRRPEAISNQKAALGEAGALADTMEHMFKLHVGDLKPWSSQDSSLSTTSVSSSVQSVPTSTPVKWVRLLKSVRTILGDHI